MLRRLLYGEVVDGRRNKGPPKKRFKDNVNTSLKKCELEQEELEECASYRPRSRTKILDAVNIFVEARRQKITADKDNAIL